VSIYAWNSCWLKGGFCLIDNVDEVPTECVNAKVVGLVKKGSTLVTSWD
jgi:hypothetical protein